MLETVLISFGVTIISGVVLLFIEYRTNWMTNRISSLTRKDLLKPIETNQLEISVSRVKWVFGTLVLAVPITALITTLISNSVIANLEQQVKIHEQYSDWNLPETIKSLHEVSQELDLTLEERNKLSQYDEMDKQISSLKKENETLQERLSKFVFDSDTITVALGETVTLVDGHYMLGLDSISNSYVTLYVGNSASIVHLGGYENIYNSSLGLDCNLYLTKINNDQSAQFKFVCKNKN